MIKTKSNSSFYLAVIAVALFFNCEMLYTQSPYYTIKFSVGETGETESSEEYKIELISCKFDYDPVIPSGDYWFGRDTSLLNWENLPDSMIQKLACSTAEIQGSSYENSSQAMIWENIYAIKIVRNTTDTMLIIFPVKIKSFVTYINLGNIPFKMGLYDLTDIVTYTFKDWLYIEIPQNYKWLPGNNIKGLTKLIK
ncbi:MAG TPA: hypothetical protein PK605_03805 [Ignavibacteria bacterium]|nr:hypothetical protein [Bacteroidota bacterium]HRE10879.1 hypothetical protein [Ignavibacteria bacterium]HRF66114.1 hypothetical protein [Ignavibacteria bacterium]HRJ03510.1 hypothetical protein [Ignavibacteria bacterium]HRJ84094.1 hypothetical protein [Ignavibacteria bacterium]